MVDYRLIILAVLSTVLFFLNQYAFEGYIQSKEHLAKELQSTSMNLSEWELSNKAPFKYRMLFPLIVKNVSKVVPGSASANQKFYWSYLFFSWLFLVATSCMLYLLLLKIFQSNTFAFLGVIIHLTMAPILFAFTLPVHTREDQMAFLFLLSAVFFLYSKKYLLYLIIACIGVFVRETLLLLPFLVLLFARVSLPKKLTLTGLPLLIWVIYRWLVGTEPYDFWLGLNWNLSNPIQLILFGFLSFSYLWVHFIFSLRIKQNKYDEFGLFSNKAVLLALLMVIATTFLFGIFNEIRLLYLIFPWMIITCLRIIARYQNLWLEFLKSKYVLICSILLVLIVGFLAPFISDLAINKLGNSQYGVPYGLWVVSFLFYLIPSMLSLIFYLFYLPKHATESNEATQH